MHNIGVVRRSRFVGGGCRGGRGCGGLRARSGRYRVVRSLRTDRRIEAGAVQTVKSHLTQRR